MARASLVQDVMNREVVAAPDSARFKELAGLMRDSDVSCLPVLDGDGSLVGVVTEEDLILKAGRRFGHPPVDPESPSRRAEHAKVEAVTAFRLMTAPAVTVDATAPLAEAARLMHDREVRHLMVTDPAGRLEGVVSRSDLLSVFLRPDEEIEQDVEDLLAHRLHGRADGVRVTVHDGVVTLEQVTLGGADVKSLIAEVEEVEGVVAARAGADQMLDRWGWRP